MSVFGYGKSYVPSSEQKLGPQQNPQTNPMFSSSLSGRGSFGGGMPGTLPESAPQFGAAQLPSATPMAPRQVTTAPGINFMPDATAPWKTEYQPVYGPAPISKSPIGFLGAAFPTVTPLNLFGLDSLRHAPRVVVGQQIKPFRNVLDTFNGKDTLLGQQLGKSFGANVDPNVGWRGDAYQTGVDMFGNPIYGEPPAYLPAGSDPGKMAAMQGPPTEVHSFKDLSDQIAGMRGSQLVNTDFRGNYVDMFQGAANNIANAFANEDYRRIHSGVTQQQAADWLQAAYNQLISRLNDAYLL